MPQVDFPQTRAALPRTVSEGVPAAPEGFALFNRQALAQLWYPTDTGDRLIYEEARVSGDNEGQLYASALTAMLQSGGARFPAGARLLDVVCEGHKLAMVEWETPGDTQERDLYTLLSASVNTLASLGAQAVAFRVNGRAAGLQGWPVGALLPSDGDLTGMWARLQLESGLDKCTRYAFIYRAALDAGSVVAELAELTLTRGEEAAAALTALRRPSNLPGTYSAFPADDGADRGAPQWESDALRLNMDANLLAMLESETIRPWQMYAATACTLLALLPEAEGVEIHVGNARVGRMETGRYQVSFDDGTMRWEDFAPVRACQFTVYEPTPDGRLEAVPRYILAREGDNALSLLNQVFSGPQSWEEGLSPIAPDDLKAESDILGLAMDGTEARVNLAPSFRRKCAELDEAQERCLVYAMVNTLCGLRNVRRVRFYVDGEPSDAFVSEISFLSPLMYNEGLARSAEE